METHPVRTELHDPENFNRRLKAVVEFFDLLAAGNLTPGSLKNVLIEGQVLGLTITEIRKFKKLINDHDADVPFKGVNDDDLIGITFENASEKAAEIASFNDKKTDIARLSIIGVVLGWTEEDVESLITLGDEVSQRRSNNK